MISKMTGHKPALSVHTSGWIKRDQYEITKQETYFIWTAYSSYQTCEKFLHYNPLGRYKPIHINQAASNSNKGLTIKPVS
ncbi:hypothetical protein GCM10028868_03080 [Virgibacillus kimchii]